MVPSQRTSPRSSAGKAKYQSGALTKASATDQRMTAARKQREAEREGEDEQVGERAPGREVEQGLEETPEGAGVRAAADGGPGCGRRAARRRPPAAPGRRPARGPQGEREERQADDEDDQAQARRQERQEDGEPGDAERKRDERVAGLAPGAEAERLGEEAGKVHRSVTVRSAFDTAMAPPRVFDFVLSLPRWGYGRLPDFEALEPANRIPGRRRSEDDHQDERRRRAERGVEVRRGQVDERVGDPSV